MPTNDELDEHARRLLAGLATSIAEQPPCVALFELTAGEIPGEFEVEAYLRLHQNRDDMLEAIMAAGVAARSEWHDPDGDHMRMIGVSVEGNARHENSAHLRKTMLYIVATPRAFYSKLLVEGRAEPIEIYERRPPAGNVGDALADAVGVPRTVVSEDDWRKVARPFN